MASKPNSLQSLWQSLLARQQKQQQEPPYWLLLESSQAFQLRNEQHSSSDTAVYRRAGLRTPSENAARDWQAGPLFLEHIVTGLLEEPHARIVWLQTIPSSQRRRAWLEKLQARPEGSRQMAVFDCCGNDPFGWDDELTNGSINLAHLDLLLGGIKKQVAANDLRVSLIVESLTPLMVRHGLDRTVKFLQKLSSEIQPVLLVVPALVETLSSSHLRKLEDLSHAILHLTDGEAELLRQGVREKGNRVRERLPYRIIDGSAIELLSSDLAEEAKPTENETNEEENATKAVASLSVAADATATSQAPPQRAAKIQLQVDEGSRRPAPPEAAAPQPRIFMQDDDPEFEDYDEEDPDDDLDL